MSTADKKDLYKAIDLLQECIRRMAQNSFNLKGWTLTILGAVFALSTRDANVFLLITIALVVISVFWYLDAFFLYIEKLYRCRYGEIIENYQSESEKDIFDLNPHRCADKLKIGKDNRKESVRHVMWSKTLWPFYGLPIAALILYCVYLLCCSKGPENAPNGNQQIDNSLVQHFWLYPACWCQPHFFPDSGGCPQEEYEEE